MSGLLNSSINGSASNVDDSSGRPFATSFSGQSVAASPPFHHTGAFQGMHNIHGNYSVPNMPGALSSRNSTMNSIASGGIQQPTGGLSNGRFSSNNLPMALSQLSHGSSHGHSGLTNRGGINVVGNHGFNSSTNGVGSSIPGILSTSAIGNRSGVPGLGVSPLLGNTGHRLSGSMGNMVGGGNMGRNISSGGGLSVSGLASRLNLGASGGSGTLNVQGQNRLTSGMLSQGSPQVISMFGNSYNTTGGPLSQSHVQAVNSLSSMGLLNDMNSSDSSPFDINDFPQLTSRPSSSGGPQGQLGSLRRQGLGPIVNQNQEFSIQNEDFPALPGYKGANADYPMDMHQKEQHNDNNVPMMQSQHFSQMGRSGAFNLRGAFSPQPQHDPLATSSAPNNQDFLHMHGSDMFPSSHSSYHSQTSGQPVIGLRPINSSNAASVMGHDQLMQQYQHQNPSQFRLQQISATNQSFRDQGMQSVQAAQSAPDPFGLLGLLNVVKTGDPDLTSLAFGLDLTTFGLDLTSTENLHKTFGSPWSNEPVKSEPEFTVPQCYLQQMPPLHQGRVSKFSTETLFYMFYSMPKDEAQLYAANELYNRGWFYHKELRIWLSRIPNVEPMVKTSSHERGSYISFDPNTFEYKHKEHFVLHYELLEKRPALPQH